jgi:hypothetical protein
MDRLGRQHTLIEYPRGRTYGECIRAELESIKLVDGVFQQRLHILAKPKLMRRKEASKYYKEKLRNAWKTLGVYRTKGDRVMEKMARGLNNVLLDVNAGTAYENFSLAIAECLSEMGYSPDSVQSLHYMKMDNGDLDVYTYIGHQKHSLIIPAESWKFGEM